MSKPFFSVVIPTYNRSDYLNVAIKSVLRQSFNDYEIIVSDNASTDDTEKICKSFKNKRIKYFKNSTNIGISRNIYKVIKLASGNYIFTLGDDDFILKKDTLLNVYNVVTKNNYGVVRLKFIYHDNYKYLFSLYFKDRICTSFKKNQNSLRLLEFFYTKVIFSFISGLIFKNIKNIKIQEIETSQRSNLDISAFWVKFLFPAAKLHGINIDHNNPIIAQWANYNNPQFYKVGEGKLPGERIWSFIFQYLNKKEREIWKIKETNQMILLLPSIKYYSNNKNLFLFSKRMLEINNTLYKNCFFYISLLIAFIMPKFLWRIIRKFFQHSQIVYEKKINNEFKQFKKLFVSN